MPFTTEELELLAVTGEVSIETRSDQRPYLTVIWVAVDQDAVYVRSVRGESGRWFRRALASPEVALEVGESHVLARAVPATDAESVRQASDGFRRKYPPSGSLDSMLRPEVLGTTLRLDPVS